MVIFSAEEMKKLFLCKKRKKNFLCTFNDQFKQIFFVGWVLFSEKNQTNKM